MIPPPAGGSAQAPRSWLVGAALTAVLVALFWPTLLWMAERFDAHESFYSHGWLIPFASGWLIWQRRHQLARCRVAPSFRGLLVLAPALLLHIVATWWNVHFVSGFAMLSALWALAWTFWGAQVVRVLRVPLAFLAFMVPLPGVLLIAISFKMKLAAATMATWFLQHGFGMSAVQAGSTIHLPGLAIVIDDTCSGLRSLISLLALSTLWGFVMPGIVARGQRLALVAASIPIALVANMVRILVLIVLGAVYGPKAAAGFIHYGSGIVVFGIALVALAWFSHALQPWPPRAFLKRLPSS